MTRILLDTHAFLWLVTEDRQLSKLEEQYRVQKQLVEEAGYDIQKYSANLQILLKDLQQLYGLTLHYGQPAGWTAKFLGRPSEKSSPCSY